MDRIVEPYQQLAPLELLDNDKKLNLTNEMRFWIDGEDNIGNKRSFVIDITLAEAETLKESLIASGIELISLNGKVTVDYVGYDSLAQVAGFDFDQVIKSVEVPQAQPPKQLIYIPTLTLLGLLFMIQRRRKNTDIQIKNKSNNIGIKAENA